MNEATQVLEADVGGVPVLFWNPMRRTTIWGRRSLRHRPVGNFGDLLGPLIVERLAGGAQRVDGPRTAPALLAVGSILQFSRPGDVVWGAGLNGKLSVSDYNLDHLDVRAVRGPRTAELLQSAFGIGTPGIFGDPGLLVPTLFPETLEWAGQKKHDLTVLPNLNDLRGVRRTRDVVSPRQELWSVVRRIAQSRLVVGSSLHGIVIAEALGVPARAVVSGSESPFKYEDYYLGTGRSPQGLLAGSVQEAVAMGGAPALEWDPAPLMSAFPADLWSAGVTAGPEAKV